MKKFYLSFGVQYTREPHPALWNVPNLPERLLEVEFEDEMSLREWAKTGPLQNKYAFIYDEKDPPMMNWFPLGTFTYDFQQGRMNGDEPPEVTLERSPNPTGIVAEAVREYVGDGDGADEEVLANYEQHVRAKIEAEMSGPQVTPLVMLEWSPNDDSPPCVDFTCVCGHWRHLCDGPEWITVGLGQVPGVECPKCGVAWSLYRVRLTEKL